MKPIDRRQFLGLAAAIPFAAEGFQQAEHAVESSQPAASQLRAQRLA